MAFRCRLQARKLSTARFIPICFAANVVFATELAQGAAMIGKLQLVRHCRLPEGAVRAGGDIPKPPRGDASHGRNGAYQKGQTS